MCGLVQSVNDNFNWSVGNGNTNTWDTGPDGAISGGHYVFIEGTGANRKDGDTAM